MFGCVSTIVLAISAVVVAGTVNQCNNGQLQCCNNIATPSQASNFLGVDLTALTGMIGINCDDIIPIAGGVSCSQQAACCSGNKQVGFQVISVDCSPINLGL